MKRMIADYRIIFLVLTVALGLFCLPDLAAGTVNTDSTINPEDLPETILNNMPSNLLVKRTDGSIDMITFIDALNYHESHHEHEAEEAEHPEAGEHLVCFGVTTAYLAIQYATAELFEDEIPGSEDFEISFAGSMPGSLDMFELFLGRSVTPGNIPLGLEAFTFFATRLSTGEQIAFGYDSELLYPEIEEFIALKNAGRQCSDPELSQIINKLAGKVLVAGPAVCFLHLIEEDVSRSPETD